MSDVQQVGGFGVSTVSECCPHDYNILPGCPCVCVCVLRQMQSSVPPRIQNHPHRMHALTNIPPNTEYSMSVMLLVESTSAKPCVVAVGSQ